VRGSVLHEKFVNLSTDLLAAAAANQLHDARVALHEARRAVLEQHGNELDVVLLNRHVHRRVPADVRPVDLRAIVDEQTRQVSGPVPRAREQRRRARLAGKVDEPAACKR
jgi:hypothetical protein